MADAYRALFIRLYPNDRPPQRELKVRLHFERAEAIATRERLPLEQAVREEYQRARECAAGHRLPLGPSRAVFWCDAGLGGLARWLRLAGYDARWNADIGDDELIEEALATGAILLTTDSLLMARGLLRDGVIPALWVPPSLDKRGQLRWVKEELGLTPGEGGEGRCPDCNAELVAIDKVSVRDRIPPRTYRWLDEYWQCAACAKIFWRGTHWQRIQSALGH